MRLGMVGLGRMGGNLVRRLAKAGIGAVVWDRDPAAVAALAAEGAEGAADLADLVKRLEAPRAVWVMLPAGAATEGALVELAGLLAPGDVAIDGRPAKPQPPPRPAGMPAPIRGRRRAMCIAARTAPGIS